MTVGLVLSARYRLVRQLGAGGMGSVWLANDLTLNADVAVKLIDPVFAESVEAVERFRQEAQSAAYIRGIHVVQILDYGVDQGRPYIAMELLTGEDLAQRLDRVHVLGALETADILGQVARALSVAHSRGIIHRDLKPENVFLVREGDEEVAKVLDFGIARRANGLSDSSVSKTRTGSMLGTPYYMSPEQATAQPVDHTTDIWSFGVLAFQCLTGRQAFEGESVGALFHAICILPLPVPSQVANVPDGFDAWFARAVSRDRAERFSTVREAAESLWKLCGRYAGSGTDYSVARSTFQSFDSLTTTGAATLASTLEQTVPPSTKTFAGLVRKSPRLTLLLALAAVAVLGLTYWRSKSESAQAVAYPPSIALPSPAQAASMSASPSTPTSAPAPSVVSVQAEREARAIAVPSSAPSISVANKPNAATPSNAKRDAKKPRKLSYTGHDNAAGI